VSARATSRTARGRTGESIASDYLWAAGHAVIAANAREGRDELDLVALDSRGALVFVEVRAYTPRPSAHPRGLASLDRAKLTRWARAARRWRARHPEHAHRPCRFDAVAVKLTVPCTVSHVRGIVLPEARETPPFSDSNP